VCEGTAQGIILQYIDECWMTSRLTASENSFRLAALDRRSDEGCGVSIWHGNTGERDCQTRRFLQVEEQKGQQTMPLVGCITRRGGAFVIASPGIV
jgi:hypothetical protein